MSREPAGGSGRQQGRGEGVADNGFALSLRQQTDSPSRLDPRDPSRVKATAGPRSLVGERCHVWVAIWRRGR
jgi:hypothetical protein